MRKALALVLLLAPTSVLAEWTLIGGATNGSFDVFVDFSTIRSEGFIVRMWTLKNFQSPIGKPNEPPIRSLKSYDEFDCKAETMRTLAVLGYTGAMGAGDFVDGSDTPESASVYVPPETTARLLFDTACRRRAL